MGTSFFFQQSAAKPTRMWYAGVVALCVMVLASMMATTGAAQAETRSLKLYFTHTGERATITFKRNGRYDQAGLRKLNRFLRDHRRGESIKMDPMLFDIVWEAYQEVGARDYIHVVSGYRSPATNAMLRRTRGGQATKSKHMTGQAMDFFIPGVSSQKLREVGFKLQGGGVGYYPRSASPYVHFDTGNVRAWPRMSRRELTRLFPRGGTAHLPSDGKPLPGYQQALADYKARKARGQATVNSGRVSRGSGGGLLAGLFGGNNNSSESSSSSNQSATASRPSAPAARRETPATVLAALSTRELPRPTASPRAARSGGVPVAITPTAPTPAAAPVEAAPAAEPTPAEAPAEVPEAASNVQLASLPVPSRRPAVLIARADDTQIADERRSATEIENTLTAQATVTPEDEALIQAMQSRSSEAAFAALPVPESAPDRPSSDLPDTATAFVPPERVTARPELDDQQKVGRLPIPAQRAIEADPIQTAALAEEQVFTTPKSARPDGQATPVAAPSNQVAAVTAPVTPESITDRITTTASLATDAGPEGRPDFVKNAQRAAPNTVYTQGFTRQNPVPDSTRFSGNAVTFLAVARFEGGFAGGDGQPLQIQIPATN